MTSGLPIQLPKTQNPQLEIASHTNQRRRLVFGPVAMGSRKEKKREKSFPLAPTKKTKSSSHRTDGCIEFKKNIKKKKNNRENKALNDERNQSHPSNGAEEEEKKNEKKGVQGRRSGSQNDAVIKHPSASQQLNYFLYQYQSANGIQLSSIELDAYKDAYMLELQDKTSQISLDEHMVIAFGPSYKEVLYEKQLVEGKVDPGNPALLVISLSALRSLELFRELRPLTRECHAVKLFSKHMKIEVQASFLKNRINIACGTPNRIKKLIEMEALGLSRLAVIVLDMHTDVKGYSLFTLPQVREEFWDLYRSHFHERLLQGDLRICLYGNIPATRRATIEVTDN